MHVFARLVKVDEQTRTVYGRAVQEVPDKSGEVFDYHSSRPYFKSWSEDFEKATEGKSVGNLRAMHGKVAAGKLTEVNFDDAEKAIDVAARVVDDAEWKKCQEGVYTGFSIGGRYARKWDDGDLKRYTAIPSEISLVDAPCVPTARFTMVKADGVEEEREFAEADGLLKQHWFCGIHEHEHLAKDDARACIAEQAVEKAESAVDAVGADYLTEGEVEKADGAKTKTVDGKHYPASDWAYVPDPEKPSTWKLRLTKTPGGKPDSSIVGAAAAALGEGFRGNKVDIPAKDLPKVRAKVRAAWKEANPDKSAKDMPASLKAQKVDTAQLTKGLYGVSRFAGILESLNELAQMQAWEEEAEGDGSEMSAKLTAAVKTLGALLVQMAQEETAELTEGDDVEIVELSDTGDIEKVAINRGRYPALAAVMAKSAGDGATASASEGNDVNKEELEKALGERDQKLTKQEETISGQAEKIEKLQGELAKAEESNTALAGKVDELAERIEKLAKSAAPGKGKVRLVGLSKSEDAGDGGDEDALTKAADALGKMSADERSLFLIKVAQRNPSVTTEG